MEKMVVEEYKFPTTAHKNSPYHKKQMALILGRYLGFEKPANGTTKKNEVPMPPEFTFFDIEKILQTITNQGDLQYFVRFT